MRFLRIVQNAARWLFRRRQAEAELTEEFRYHLEQEIENNIRSGMNPQEARAAALLLIGPISYHQEECRDSRGTALLENFLRDLRYAIHMLRRTPLFTAAAILTLALGIGANTTVFTFVENILLRPLPVRDPHQLVFLNWGGMQNMAYPNYSDFRGRNRVFSDLIAYRFNVLSLGIQARGNYRVWSYEASGNYFEALGIRPLLGRFFGPEEDRTPEANPVMVIGYRFWRSRFAADPLAVGRQVKVNGYPFTIIGVAPPGFGGTELITNADYWVPMSMEPRVEPGNDWLSSRHAQNLWTMGRLKPGVSRAQAEADLDRIAQDLAAAYPDVLDAKSRFHLSDPGLIGTADPVASTALLLAAHDAIRGHHDNRAVLKSTGIPHPGFIGRDIRHPKASRELRLVGSANAPEVSSGLRRSHRQCIVQGSLVGPDGLRRSVGRSRYLYCES